MKTKISIILLFFSISIFGQVLTNAGMSTVITQPLVTPFKTQKLYKESVKSLVLNISAIALEAVGDGLLDQGRVDNNIVKMRYGHALQAGSVAVLLSKPLIQDLSPYEWGADIISYCFLRVGIFNPIYNTTRGLPIWYLGDTSIYDHLLVKLNNPPPSYSFINALGFIAGVVIPLDRLYKYKTAR